LFDPILNFAVNKRIFNLFSFEQFADCFDFGNKSRHYNKFLSVFTAFTVFKKILDYVFKRRKFRFAYANNIGTVVIADKSARKLRKSQNFGQYIRDRNFALT
jgi:hypothetical protein